MMAWAVDAPDLVRKLCNDKVRAVVAIGALRQLAHDLKTPPYGRQFAERLADDIEFALTDG
jgi:hypothetical protein